ncbi:LexA family protein [Symbiopectobacterium sp. Eva_TO]
METLGQRIKSLRKLKKYTQVTLGKSIGVTGVTVGYWEKDLNEPGGKALSKLAKALNTTESYLLYGTDPGSVTMIHDSMHMVPLLSWDEAMAFIATGGNEMPKNANNTATFVTASQRAFCVKIDDDTMVNPYGKPSIPQGSMIIVDPLVEPENGKIVAAIISDSSNQPPRSMMTVKKLVMDGFNNYLMPLNPRYDKILVTDACKIVGTVIGVQFAL